MKKYLLSLFVFTTLVGCSNDNLDNNNSEGNTTTPKIYTAPLTIDLSSKEATRAFDADWNWEWSEADTIYVFQDAGERIITPMTHVGDGKFHAEVTYSTLEPANFCFMYGGKIRHSYQNGEYSTSHIIPYHGKIWTPVMGALLTQTTVQEISEVILYPISGAIEIRAWEADRTTPAKIKRATLKVFGKEIYLKWNAQGEVEWDLINENTPEDEIISAYCEEGSTSLFIQMPKIVEEDNMATPAAEIEITNIYDETLVVHIPFATINIGKRSVMNVVANEFAYAEVYDPKAFFNQIVTLASSGIDPTVTNKMKFVANSNINTASAVKLDGISSAYATLSNDMTTFEIHTPKPEFYVKEGVDIGNMFLFGDMITSLDFGDNFNTENVTKMDSLFLGAQNMSHLYLGKSFTTENVTDMSCMFMGCMNLKDLDLSNFDTRKVTNMAGMFLLSFITNNINLDLSSFNTENVTNMSNMFSLSGISSLDISNFNTSKVTNMSGMFALSTYLTSLDLSNFNISNVTNMEAMFGGCDNIQTLNITSFDFSHQPNVTELFASIIKYVDGNGNPHEGIPNYMSQKCVENTGEKCKVYISQEGFDYLNSKTDIAESPRFPSEYAEYIIVD